MMRHSAPPLFSGCVKWKPVFGDAIPWSAIEGGFNLLDTQVHLSCHTRGIFRLRQKQQGVLSIKTTMPRQL